MHALIRNALAQRKESVRVILRCEAKETLAGERCRLEKPEAYSLEYVEGLNGETACRSCVSALAAETS
jgi:hypothetical protein